MLLSDSHTLRDFNVLLVLTIDFKCPPPGILSVFIMLGHLWHPLAQSLIVSTVSEVEQTQSSSICDVDGNPLLRHP